MINKKPRNAWLFIFIESGLLDSMQLLNQMYNQCIFCYNALKKVRIPQTHSYKLIKKAPDWGFSSSGEGS